MKDVIPSSIHHKGHSQYSCDKRQANKRKTEHLFDQNFAGHTNTEKKMHGSLSIFILRFDEECTAVLKCDWIKQYDLMRTD